MPVVFEGAKKNFATFAHFKEVAIKRINETHGRKNPYDIFDFSETKDMLKCVAFRDHEDNLPAEQTTGEIVSKEAEAVAENAETFTLDEILNASDAAITLATENGVDIAAVTGTGKDGNVKIDDVRNYIKINAPLKDNANETQTDNNDK